MQNKNNIRKANILDLEPIFLIEKEVFKDEHWSLNMIKSELVKSIGKTTWIIEESNIILGYCMTSMVQKEMTIINMAIKTSHQFRGLGITLLGYVLNQLPPKYSIFLEVKKGNFIALKLYRRYGFQVIGLRKQYYKDGSSALVMHLQT